MNKITSTKVLTLMGVLIAIQVVLTFTPLGLIPLGFMNATTLHIPVIIGAILLGPIEGGILGFVFGSLSIITNTIRPNPTSFVFSPFITIGDVSGSYASLIVALLPRILVGLTAYYSYKAIYKYKAGIPFTSGRLKVADFSYAGAAIVGSLTNTILVMGSIYIFFGQQYAAAKDIAFEALFGVIMGIVGMNGIPEAIVAAILVTAICKMLKKVFRGNI